MVNLLNIGPPGLGARVYLILFAMNISTATDAVELL